MSHEKFMACIEACSECAVECNHCANACLNEADVKMLIKCIRINKDCAAICLLAVDLMSAGSQFAERICELCTEVCESCANECGSHAHMDHCVKCAEICRNCAEACRKMSASHVL
jgi:hypothetical protein